MAEAEAAPAPVVEEESAKEVAKDEVEKDGAWLVDMVIHFVHSPSWSMPVMAFIEEKCVLFDNFQEENRHEYVEVHNDFKNLIDSLLTAHLLEVDILPEDFEKQCIEKGLGDDPRLQKVITQLVAAEDFIKFKDMMIEKHTTMTLSAETNFQEMSSAEEAAATEAAIQAAAEAEAKEAAAVAAAADAAEAATAVPAPSAAPASPSEAAAPKEVSAEEERKFGAGGGHYGRAGGGGAKKPAGNEKAAAIRKALCACRPRG